MHRLQPRATRAEYSRSRNFLRDRRLVQLIGPITLPWKGDGPMVDQRFFALRVRTAPILEVGVPGLLFELPFAPAGGVTSAWDVTPDAQPFIFVKPGDDELVPLRI